MRVITHATEIENAKAALRAGVDAFAHMITEVDDELLSLFIERPQVAVLLPVAEQTRPYLQPVS